MSSNKKPHRDSGIDVFFFHQNQEWAGCSHWKGESVCVLGGEMLGEMELVSFKTLREMVVACGVTCSSH